MDIYLLLVVVLSSWRKPQKELVAEISPRYLPLPTSDSFSGSALPPISPSSSSYLRSKPEVTNISLYSISLLLSPWDFAAKPVFRYRIGDGKNERTVLVIPHGGRLRFGFEFLGFYLVIDLSGVDICCWCCLLLLVDRCDFADCVNGSVTFCRLSELWGTSCANLSAWLRYGRGIGALCGLLEVQLILLFFILFSTYLCFLNLRFDHGGEFFWRGDGCGEGLRPFLFY